MSVEYCGAYCGGSAYFALYNGKWFPYYDLYSQMARVIPSVMVGADET